MRARRGGRVACAQAQQAGLNPKQFQIRQIQMTKTLVLAVLVSIVLNIGEFVFWICLGFRASDFGFLPVPLRFCCSFL